MPQGYRFVPVSVDSLEWTAHWLKDSRCDLLGVFLADQPTTMPAVRIVAIESKAVTTPDPIELSPETEPFRKGVSQVVATLDALEEVLCQDRATSLVADLKLSAFIEHLTSEVLARISPIHAGEGDKIEVLKTLTRLSRRQLTCGEGLSLEGVTVVTETELSVAATDVSIQAGDSRWPVKLVRCGTLTLRELFETEGMQALASQLGIGVGATTPPPQQVPTTPEITEQQEIHVATEAQRERLLQLEVACRSRGFQIGKLDEATVLEGPTLMSVSVALAAGESLRPIQNASADIARELGVHSVTIENDPGRPYYVRFLLPKSQRTFPEVPQDQLPAVDQASEQYLNVWLGAEVDGKPYRSAVSEWPHLLIAGTTGSGKTTFLKSILTQLDRFGAEDLRVAVVDGKAEYDYIDLVRRDLFTPRFPEVLLGHTHAKDVLEWIIDEEVPRRRQALTTYFRDNADAPRSPKAAFIAAVSSGRRFPISPLVVFIDEFAEIMAASGAIAEEFAQLVQRTVQGGRSALVHLVLATQRPDATVVRGAIKANLPSRVALQLPSHHDSMTVLNSAGAEDLLGAGDLLFEGASGGRVRLQGYFPAHPTRR